LRIPHITLFVYDIDETLTFYTEKIRFIKRADMTTWAGTRCVTVSPKEQLMSK